MLGWTRREQRLAVHVCSRMLTAPPPGAARPAAPHHADAPAGGRRGPAHRPGDARPRQPGDHEPHVSVERRWIPPQPTGAPPAPESPRASPHSRLARDASPPPGSPGHHEGGTAGGACTGPVLSPAQPVAGRSRSREISARCRGAQRWPFPVRRLTRLVTGSAARWNPRLPGRRAAAGLAQVSASATVHPDGPVEGGVPIGVARDRTPVQARQGRQWPGAAERVPRRSPRRTLAPTAARSSTGS